MAMLQLAAPSAPVDLYDAYLEWLARRGVGNPTFRSGARSFLARFPDPQRWADEPLRKRLSLGTQTRPFLNFLMLHGHLHPGYDYLLERRLHSVLRDGEVSPLGTDLATFLTGAERLGYSERARIGMASQVAVRLLIESGRRLCELGDGDAAAFTAALEEREARDGRAYKHYRIALFASRAVLYHLGAPMSQVPQRSVPAPWSWRQHLEGVNDALARKLSSTLRRVSFKRSVSAPPGAG